jgi:Na+-driven multidrug efflux pump
LFTSGTLVFINFRSYFFNQGFPDGTIENKIGVAAILSLTMAILNIFTTTYNAIGTVCAKFVGAELGNNNIEQAQKNSKELKGFLTSIALLLAFILLVISFLIPEMTFLVNGETKENGVLILKYTQKAL